MHDQRPPLSAFDVEQIVVRCPADVPQNATFVGAASAPTCADTTTLSTAIVSPVVGLVQPVATLADAEGSGADGAGAADPDGATADAEAAAVVAEGAAGLGDSGGALPHPAIRSPIATDATPIRLVIDRIRMSSQ